MIILPKEFSNGKASLQLAGGLRSSRCPFLKMENVYLDLPKQCPSIEVIVREVLE